MSAYIYIEGGGTGAQSKETDVRCREGFRKLLEKCGFRGRMPRLVACGGRDAALSDFIVKHISGQADSVFLWVDSEDPMTEIEASWAHLRARDQWKQPEGAKDEQVLFMTTCMETWIVADRSALRDHFGDGLQHSALPPLDNLESQNRHHIQEKLVHATRNCSNAYSKGQRSFGVLGKLEPATLKQHLPSFARVYRILNARL